MKMYRYLFFVLCGVFFLGSSSVLGQSQSGQVPDVFKVKLSSSWRFAVDPGEEGIEEGWYEKDFDDSSWQLINSGLSWEKQGIKHQGWGWYRQRITIPAEYAGMPLKLKLGTTASDDEAFVNGIRIGGFTSEYKYVNMQDRVYMVPSSTLRYGEENTIAVRVWGGDLSFIGATSGLAAGTFEAEIDPYATLAGYEDEQGVEFHHINLFDFSDAQRARPFKLVFRFAEDVLEKGAAYMEYTFSDFQSNKIKSGEVPIELGSDGTAHAEVSIDSMTSQTIYYRGRFKAALKVLDGSRTLLQQKIDSYDYLSFVKRDTQILPSLSEQWDETPYGSLKLVDEIDCSVDISNEEHGYLQGNFTTKDVWHNTPGGIVNVSVNEVLGKKAREAENGWFAYKIGRGKLVPHNTYLLRIEYPEDKPRYCPIEVQIGQNYMDAGWRSGVNDKDDPYDNWPLNNAWNYYDVIVSLDDETLGAGGTGSASSETGFWVFFMNKLNGNYFRLYEGGPAIASMKLYEIDPEMNAPVINKPSAGLPERILMFDWERQPDHEPADLVKYAKLMGYNAISPVIVKWIYSNYSDPLVGYESVNVDNQNYWTSKEYFDYETGIKGEEAVPGKASVYERYLEATKGSGLYFIPRIEYGGSDDLDPDAIAKDVNGISFAKPNRGGMKWCANLLNPATLTDFKVLMDHLFKGHVADNPQLAGMLWRIRYDRLPISYGKDDIAMYNAETGGSLSFPITNTNSVKKEYANWWHQKRRDFHAQVVEALKSYRSDLRLYYYNWDNDKFSIVLPDLNSGSFYSNPNYAYDREVRREITTEEYLNIVESGNFGESFGKNSPDYGLRPYLYSDVEGIELLAPANILHLANNGDYLNYFKTADGVSVSNCVSYDEIHSRSINPKYEGNVTTPGGAAYSMAFELMQYFHSDARTLTYTVYTYGRGFANAHRRFAQAFLSLPATRGVVVENPDADVKIRVYNAENESYIGVASKSYEDKEITVKLPLDGTVESVEVKNLVTGDIVPSIVTDGELQFVVNSGPIELNSFLLDTKVEVSGIDTNDFQGEVSLFPNPVEDMLNVKLGEDYNGVVLLSIVDNTGREFMRRNFNGLNTVTLNVSDLPQGTYICKVVLDESTFNIKFMK